MEYQNRQNEKARDAANVTGEEYQRTEYIADDAPDATENTLQWVPFPVELVGDDLASFAREKAIELNADCAYVGVPMLSVIAASAGLTAVFRVHENRSVLPITWTCGIGRSGTSKTPAGDAAVAPLEVEQMHRLRDHQHAMQEHAKVLAQHQPGKSKEPAPPAPVAERYIVHEPSTASILPKLNENPHGLLLYAREADTWLGSFGASARGDGATAAERAKWLLFYDGVPILSDRKSDGLTWAERSVVHIICATQDKVLRKSLGAEGADTGLLARMSTYWPPDTLQRVNRTVMPSKYAGRWAAHIGYLLDRRKQTTIEQPVREMQTTERGIGLLLDYEDEVLAMRQEQPDVVLAMLSKNRGLAYRLAPIIALADDADARSISTEQVERAIRLARWMRHEQVRVYTELGITTEGIDHDLLEWLRGKADNGVLNGEVLARFKRYQTAPEARAALGALVNARLIRKVGKRYFPAQR